MIQHLNETIAHSVQAQSCEVCEGMLRCRSNRIFFMGGRYSMDLDVSVY